MPFILTVFGFFKKNSIAALVLAAVLLYWYHYLVVSIQESKINVLEKNNDILKTNQRAIETANETLQANIKELVEQQNNINRILKEKELTDTKITQDFATVKSKIEGNNAIDLDKINEEVMCLSSSLKIACFDRAPK